MAPMTPHITAELWERRRGGRIHDRTWPEADPARLTVDTVTLVVQVNGKVRDRLEVAADIDEREAERLALASDKVSQHLGDGEPAQGRGPGPQAGQRGGLERCRRRQRRARHHRRPRHRAGARERKGRIERHAQDPPRPRRGRPPRRGSLLGRRPGGGRGRPGRRADHPARRDQYHHDHRRVHLHHRGAPGRRHPRPARLGVGVGRPLEHPRRAAAGPVQPVRARQRPRRRHHRRGGGRRLPPARRHRRRPDAGRRVRRTRGLRGHRGRHRPGRLGARPALPLPGRVPRAGGRGGGHRGGRGRRDRRHRAHRGRDRRRRGRGRRRGAAQRHRRARGAALDPQRRAHHPVPARPRPPGLHRRRVPLTNFGPLDGAGNGKGPRNGGAGGRWT
ncbi:MAG: class I tRNA ligase family protein [Acidimicrobiia bacterium]|nr:class I tRNA ligase family protein [Acidimicrobiia bacterium]